MLPKTIRIVKSKLASMGIMSKKTKQGDAVTLQATQWLHVIRQK